MTESTHWTFEEATEKIAKLLAKAESTTPAEAEAITERAEQLMMKYSIDQAVLNSRRAARGERVDEKIIEWTIQFTGTYHRGLLYTFNTISDALEFRTMFRRGTNWSSLTFMGYESDVENGKLLITSLQLQLTAALTAWWKTYDGKSWMTPMEKFKARRSFMFSFADGIAHRVRSRRRTLIREAEVASPGTTLAVRDRNAALERAYSALGLKSVNIKMDITDTYAWVSGYEAGKNADTGDSRLDEHARRALES